MHANTWFRHPRLFCPGPTPLALQTQVAALGENPYHRTAQFFKTFSRCRQLLAEVMGSRSLPLILTSSGTGAMEAAVTNLTAAGDQVLTINAGKFGARWTQLCQAYSCQTTELACPWGESPSLATLGRLLQEAPATKAVFLQATETSTGVSLPVAAITAECKKHSQALVVVDAISALGVEPLPMDQWGVDVLISGSQKAFGVPPGLAFINLSEQAWQSLSTRPRFYFDLQREKHQQDKAGSAFTPATSLVLMLTAALESFHEQGWEQIYANQRQLAQAVRQGLQALGLTLFAASHPAIGLTAVRLPAAVDGKALLHDLQTRFAMTFAGGQDHYAGKLLRFAHLGFWDTADLAAAFLALESALTAQGHSCPPAAGAQRFWQSLLPALEPRPARL